MPSHARRWLSGATLLAAFAASFLLAGCQPWVRAPWPARPDNRATAPADHPNRQAASEQADREGTTASDGAAVQAVLARDVLTVEGRQRSVWIRALDRASDEPRERGCRWRYPDLDDLLSRPAESRPDLRGVLASGNPVVAANAAIGLARLGDDAGARQLVATIRAPKLSIELRRAAAEALGTLGGPAAVGSLQELIRQYGDAAPGTRAHAIPDLHAELIRALARRVAPAEDPDVNAAIGSLSPEVRLEAIRAMGGATEGVLPQRAVDMRADSDARVRAAALDALVRHRHPNAEEYMTDALRDTNPAVRIAAVAALGRLGTSSARGTLKTLTAETYGETVRAAAVSALAVAGDRQAVAEAIHDKSWRVRLVVAQTLAEYTDRLGSTQARQLLDDRNPQVQQQVIAAIRQWPIEQAGPILLEAMSRSGYLTRKQAAVQLADRWPPAAAFPIEGPQSRRDEVREQLRRAFVQRFGIADKQVLAEASRQGGAPSVSPEAIARADALLGRLSDPRAPEAARRDVLQAMLGFGPELVGALERLVLDRGRLLPESVYREALPHQEEAFAALARLNDEDPVARRGAADALARLAAKQPLRPLAGERLAQLAAKEPDALVWRSVLGAIRDDPSPQAARIAAIAISHPAPEVRRQSCEYFHDHPDPAHAKFLAPALQDPSHSVAVAAVRALGAAGRLDDVEPLRQMLANPEESLRAEAAVVLSRLGDPSGVSALERLSYSGDVNVRRQVAKAMGDAPHPSFAAALVRLLDDQQSVCQAALESLPRVVGRDATESPTPQSTSQRIASWKNWLRQQDNTVFSEKRNQGRP